MTKEGTARLFGLGLQKRLIPLEVPDGCLEFTNPAFLPAVDFSSRSFQLDCRFGVGQVQGKRRTDTGVGESWGISRGLAGQRVLLLVGVEQSGLARLWRTRERCSVPWLGVFAQKELGQCSFSCQPHCPASFPPHCHVPCAFLSQIPGWEMSKGGRLGCTEGVLVARILS